MRRSARREILQPCDLAECLGIDRLNLLQVLRHLDQKLGLVRDVPADEDRYAFRRRSCSKLFAINWELGNRQSKGELLLLKIARELHARIAAMFERRSPRTAELAYSIAQHYYAAGSAFASQTLDACIHAARAARKTGLYFPHSPENLRGDGRAFVAMGRI